MWLSLSVLCLGCALLALPGSARAEGDKPWIQEMEKTIKARWAGKSVANLTDRLGPPKESKSTDKLADLTWQRKVYLGVNRGASFECSATFHFEADHLAGVMIAGDDMNFCRKLLYPLLSEPEPHK